MTTEEQTQIPEGLDPDDPISELAAKAAQNPEPAGEPEESETGEGVAAEPKADAESGADQSELTVEELQAQLEEKERQRKGLEVKFVETRRGAQRLEQLLQQLQQHAPQEAPEPEAEAAPDPDVDPAGYMRHGIGRVEEAAKRVEQTVGAQEQERQLAQISDFVVSDTQQAREQGVKTTVKISDTEAEDLSLDGEQFQAAQKEAERIAKSTAIAAGLTSPEDVAAYVRRVQAGLTMQALQSGVRPVEKVVQYAAAYGWRPEATNGSKPEGGDLSAEAEKRQRSRSVTRAGSPGSSGGRVTAKDLAKMTDKQYAAYMKQVEKSGASTQEELDEHMRQVMGG